MAKAKTSITTENRSGSAADAAAKEKRTEMPLSDLHPFEGHPFKVLDDELMEQTVESIKQIGVVSPLIVRPDPEDGFEILSGHRRLHAAQLAGLETVPVIVKEMDDDAAIIFMVDSNLQRENILPSERAFSYKMKLEAMKHQGERGDLTSAQVGPKSWAAQVVAEEAGDSKSQVKRLSAIIFVIVYGRMVEIYLMVSLAPIPFATFGNHEQSHTGQNYLRSLFALGFQGFLIMICVGIYETKAGKKVRKLTKFNEIDGKRCDDVIPTIITIIAKGRTTIDSRLKAYRCELCGYEGKDRKYEVHHVNKVKNLKGKEPWEIVMIAKRRKTMVVCHDCHQKIHHGF